ncbi:putative ECF RNA polymerase sigma factor SigI [Aliarcobacter thereius]|uniref:Putative ECF RNA polymerase sigma factor SigI n=1 Tax=Aliarcobacter thereius TaxID=544718 RepID=A0A1C0B7N3_9BACT|nr:sigma-70 family RNA polymerase sigma factor [Aliarcobacter thereius]OCL87855.1 putative ECF RNA polymerase sigma factor SigI [Aliarcobacter thereius]OCL99594.1 putative ECF RNA polymerase sigma factor SigI [Aliarcobacter thereius]TLS72975.1 sigma-70 family RNA polymerase sigma factor [Aliarcobacter thereius]TLT08387.1 sigma-70 family RNA polymerase sigma factor [Aliarcobacter thereius]
MLKYYNELLYFSFRLVGDQEKAKDIIQESYSRFIEIKNRKEIKNERAYLYKIAKNIVVQEAMENKKLSRTLYEENICFSPECEQPEEILIQEDQENIFLQSIEKLAPRQKEAYILFTIEGYSRKEIAEMMDITSNAVEKLIKRATLKIEEELEKRGF